MAQSTGPVSVDGSCLSTGSGMAQQGSSPVVSKTPAQAADLQSFQGLLLHQDQPLPACLSAIAFFIVLLAESSANSKASCI